MARRIEDSADSTAKGGMVFSSQAPEASWPAYVVALGAVLLAALIRWLLDPIFGDNLPFLTFFGAVALTVWVGGWRAALLAAGTGFLVAEYLFISPRLEFALDQLFGIAALGGYSLSCGLIIFFGAAERRATARARREAAERAELERLVRQQRAQLQQVIDTTPFMLTRCSRDLRYVFVSAAYARMLGRTPRELAGRPIVEVMGERGLAKVMPYLQHVLSGEMVEYETEVPLPNVGTKTLHVLYRPDRDREGTVIGWFGSILDLTDRKKTERSLRRSMRRQEAIYQLANKLQRATCLEDIYRAALDAVLQGLRCDRASILLFDENGVMRFVAAHDLSESYREAVEGHSPWKPDTQEATPISIGNIADAEIDDELKSTIRHEGIGALAFIPLMEGGKLIGKFMSYFNQPHVFEPAELETGLAIGRQFSTALQRHRAEARLRESEQRTVADLEATRKLYELGTRCLNDSRHFEECLGDILETAVSITRADRGTLQLVDPESGRLAIAAQRGFEKPFLTFFARVQSGDGAACGRAMQDARRVVIEDVAASEMFAGAPAREILLTAGVRAVQSTPLLSSAGHVVGIISTHFTHAHRPDDREVGFMDVLARQTADYIERTRAAEALREAKRKAEEANQAKDQFLAMLSHELRTPLTPVLLAASLLERDPALPSASREELTMIRRNIELEARLIDDLLDLTRITHGKLALHQETTDVHLAIERALNISLSEANAKELRITRHLDALVHHSFADAARLQEVFWNVFRNAVKFTPARGIIEIHTRNDPRGGDLVIEIADSGIGIQPELQPRIFDAFAQGDPTVRARFGGLGLGLAISKRIIELHGGTIEVQSAGRDQGSTFVIRLQVAPQLAGRIDGSPGIDVAAPGQMAEILLVEDHRDTARVLTRILKTGGYSVVACGSVAEALRVANERRFDLLISDIGLPDGSGLELMRGLREIRPITGIAISGYGTTEDVGASEAAGFSMHLTKPVDIARLRTAIATILGSDKAKPAVRAVSPGAAA